MDIIVGHSPDADDAFMFYAMTAGKIDCGEYKCTHALHDIETLNKKADSGEIPITAMSVAAYPYVADKYDIMRAGGSFGDGYGPVLVTSEEVSAESLQGKKIAIPGTKTSAYLALRLWAENIEFKPVIVPFDKIMDCVKQGDVAAGLLIHEGQLTYGEEGFHLIVDLGVWWKERTKLPLPLGVNAIRKDLPEQVKADLTRLLSESIDYALNNRDEALKYAIGFSRGMTDIDRNGKFVDMYVNQLTVDMGDRGSNGISLFLEEGSAKGFINEIQPVFT